MTSRRSEIFRETAPSLSSNPLELDMIHAIPNLISYAKREAPVVSGAEDSEEELEGLEYFESKLFNDPSADLSFLSSDRFIFRVHSWHLKKGIDLRDVTGAKHGIDDFMVFDVGSEILRYFLAAFYGNTRHHVDLPWACCLKLLKLADRFQAPEVEKNLLMGMAFHGWNVFQITAEKNLSRVGQACVKHFNQKSTPIDLIQGDIGYPNTGAFNKLPTNWAYALVRCRMKEHIETDKGGSSGYELEEEEVGGSRGQLLCVLIGREGEDQHASTARERTRLSYHSPCTYNTTRLASARLFATPVATRLAPPFYVILGDAPAKISDAQKQYIPRFSSNIYL